MTVIGPAVISPLTVMSPVAVSAPSMNAGTYGMNPPIAPPSESQFGLVVFQPRSAELSGRHVCEVAEDETDMVIVSFPSTTANEADAPAPTVAVGANCESDVMPLAACMTV